VRDVGRYLRSPSWEPVWAAGPSRRTSSNVASGRGVLPRGLHVGLLCQQTRSCCRSATALHAGKFRAARELPRHHAVYGSGDDRVKPRRPGRVTIGEGRTDGSHASGRSQVAPFFSAGIIAGA